jgi:hypothetical protein
VGGQPGLATVAMLQITPNRVVRLHHTEPHHIKGLLDGGQLEMLVPGRDAPVRWHAYLDSDGKGKALPFNHLAHDLAALGGWTGWAAGDYLVGPVVFLGEDPTDSAAEGDVPAELLRIGVQGQLWTPPCPQMAGYTRQAKCHMCARLIFNRPGQDWWEDEEGWTRCLKHTGVIVGVNAGTPVPGHQPMPDGLIGAPTDLDCGTP